MTIDVITLFPQQLETALSYSIIKRARDKGLLNLGFINPRDFVKDKHKTVDLKPYGGGSGMLMMAEPVYKAIKSVKKKNSKVILLTPRGRLFNHQLSKELSKEKHLIIICAHYEGIDERITKYIDMEISIGDFVLTGGEPAAICIVDSITRLCPRVIKKESKEHESFSNFLLEHPHYTRPRIWKKMKVPDVLLSGNHEEIKKWRNEQSVKITRERRPDLYEIYLKLRRRK